MAYIGQKEKKELAPGIKAVLKKYGMKGTIGIDNHSGLKVNLKEGVIDFGETNYQVNTYHIDSWYSGTVKKFLQELHKAMKGTKWFDKSDIMTDYFHTAYYIDINIGKWSKPYVKVGA